MLVPTEDEEGDGGDQGKEEGDKVPLGAVGKTGVEARQRWRRRLGGGDND